MNDTQPTLPEFIGARLNEWEALAGAASPSPWTPNAEHDEVIAVDGVTVCDGFALSGRQLRATVDHIAYNDPAFVLTQIEVLREIVEWFTPRPITGTDAELHARCAHPAWEYETTEGQRKCWDDVNRPPKGDGWERNVDHGRDGWERFDYTEESYWRRPLPNGPRIPQPPTMLRPIAALWRTHPDYPQP